MKKTMHVCVLALILCVIASCAAPAVREQPKAPAERTYTSAGTPIIRESEYDEEEEGVDPWDISLRDTPDSTCFSEIGWEKNTLVVVFRDSGATYCYRDVPKKVWDEFRTSNSLGGYFNKYIKGTYDCEKMEE